ncbi:MAG: glycosyltransferase family 9 protein [Acidobacteria bacterium]|nr:glycosyltransferase family 9 protein [Acidobacteriota bacterium]
MARTLGADLRDAFSSVEVVVVRLPSWMGDILMARPFLVELRRQTRARVVALVRAAYAELAAWLPEVDDVLSMPDEPAWRRWAYLWRRRPTWVDRSLGITLAHSLASAVELCALGVPWRYGYATDHRRLFLTHWMTAARGHRTPESLHFLRLLLPILGSVPEVPVALPGLRFPEEVPPPTDFPEDYVFVYADASRRPRAWPSERYIRLIQRLTACGQAVVAAWPRWAPPLPATDRVHILRPDVPLLELARVIRGARWFIGNDGGPAHLAAALGVPCSVIYGPGHPARHRPIGTGQPIHAIHADWPCSPCRQKFFRECRPVAPFRPACLDVLNVEFVWRPVATVLGLLR